jgi:hypothetical protein
MYLFMVHFTMLSISRLYNYSVDTILVGKPEGTRPTGRPRRGWVDNIKMDLREIGWDGVDWIDMAQDRDQWRYCENDFETSGSINCWGVLEWLHNWRLLKKGSAA